MTVYYTTAIRFTGVAPQTTEQKRHQQKQQKNQLFRQKEREIMVYTYSSIRVVDGKLASE
jgi:hypothetical protein